MRAVSLFSGIGGLEYGLQMAGIQTILQVESDAWCRAVLEHHWPEVQRVDDVRKVDAAARFGGSRNLARAGRLADAERPRSARRRRGDAVGAGVDIVYGGFPCQDVSVAGQRAGLSGERSGLWFEFERILRELRPPWCLVENVPGLLSSGSSPGADFGVILRGLVDLGYGVAWRVLDARWFGTPQRRRRVFVVGCLGDAPRAAQVLAVCESCGGHPASSGETGQRVAATLSGGAHTAGVNVPGRHHEDDDNLILGSQLDEGMARPLVARGTGYRMDLESETFVVAPTIQSGGHSNNPMDETLVANPIRASDGHHGWSGPRGDGDDNLVIAEGVRRLTPLECERLQGFPDGWTDLGIADSHRYRMLGNAVDTVVAQWLGHRLARVDAG